MFIHYISSTFQTEAEVVNFVDSVLSVCKNESNHICESVSRYMTDIGDGGGIAVSLEIGKKSDQK